MIREVLPLDSDRCPTCTGFGALHGFGQCVSCLAGLATTSEADFLAPVDTDDEGDKNSLIGLGIVVGLSVLVGYLYLNVR